MSGIDRKAAHAALDRVIDADEYGKDEEAAQRLNDLLATLQPVLQYIWEGSKYPDAPVPESWLLFKVLGRLKAVLPQREHTDIILALSGLHIGLSSPIFEPRYPPSVRKDRFRRENLSQGMGGLLIYWAEMVENVEGKPLGIAKAVEQLCTVIQCSDRQAYRWLSNVTEEEKAAIKGFLWKWKKNGFPHDGDDFHNDLDKAGFPGLSATFAYLRPPAISMKKWAAWWHRRCNESSTYER